MSRDKPNQPALFGCGVVLEIGRKKRKKPPSGNSFCFCFFSSLFLHFFSCLPARIEEQEVIF